MYLLCIDISLAMVYFIGVVWTYLRGSFIMLASKHKRNNIKYVSIKIPPFTSLLGSDEHLPKI